MIDVPVHEEVTCHHESPSIEWMLRQVTAYPELLWLAEGEVAMSQEGSSSENGSWSEQLFGKKWPELDRSLTSLLSLDWILSGSEEAYRQLVGGQNKEIRLSWDAFLSLHREGTELINGHPSLSPEEVRRTMEVGIVLGDMGKTSVARTVFGLITLDHDDFLGKAYERLQEEPSLAPSFAGLNTIQRDLLSKGANLIHYGHVTHLEGGRNMFSRLISSGLAKSDPFTLRLDQFLHWCDVAGAAGQADCRSAKMLTQPVFDALALTFQACRTLEEPEATEQTAIDFLLSARGKWLGLNPETDALLIRAGAMLRLTTPEEGEALRRGRPQPLPLLTSFEQDYPTPTYVPAFLLNLMNNPDLAPTRLDRISKTFKLGLPFVSAVLEQYLEMRSEGQIELDIRLNWNHFAGLVKNNWTVIFREARVDPEGVVRLNHEDGQAFA